MKLNQQGVRSVVRYCDYMNGGGGGSLTVWGHLEVVQH